MKRLQFLLTVFFLLTASQGDAQVVQTDKSMSISQKRQLLTFVQDVVSVGIERDFENGKISNQELVRFGIYQVALRHIHLFEDGKTEGEARLASKYVSNVVVQYFGKTIRHQSVGDWKYKNGYYNGYHELFEQLGPEKIKLLRIFGVGKSNLTIFADYVDSMASADSNKDSVVKTRMIVKKVSSRGMSHYILTSYKSLSQKP